MKKSFKNVGNRLILTLAAAFALVLITAFPVKAASKPSPITNLKQKEVTSDLSTSCVWVSWSCLGGSDTRYKIEVSEQPSTGYRVVDRDTSSTSESITELSAGKTYYVRVTPFVEDDDTYEIIWGDTSAPVKVVTAPDKAPATLTHTKSTTNSITVNWSAVPGADIYQVTYYKDYCTDSSKVMRCVTTGTSITLKKLAKNEAYTVCIIGGRKYADGTTVAWAWSDNSIFKMGISVKPSNMSGVDVTHYWQSSSEICMEHSEMACADGYQYQLYTAYKDKDSKIKTVTTNSPEFFTYIRTAALKKHNFYKVRVRAYALNSKNEKMYGGWSSWKYVSPQPDVTKIKNNKSKKGIQISWDKIKGADRYVVYVSTKYVSTKKASGYKKSQTTTKNGTVITKCGKNKLKSGKTYYFYVVPQKKVGNKYVSGLAGNADEDWCFKYKK